MEDKQIKLTPKEEKAKRRMERREHGFFAEFKKFIMKGNVVDMATGVIVAASFKDIITSLTNDIFMPWINYLMFNITGGKKGELITILNNEPYFITKGESQVVNPACIFINWGKFINAIVNFLLIALIIFLTIKIIQSVRKKLAKVRAKINEEQIEAEKAYMAKVEAKEKAEAAKKAEEKANADKAKAEEKSTNELLVEVINLLNK